METSANGRAPSRYGSLTPFLITPISEADNQFIMGFYFRHTAGVHSEGILIRQKIFSEQDIAANLGEHFKALWADNKDNTLCSIRAEQGFFKPEVRSNATRLKNELR
jgi:hypothetical protein